MVESLPYIDEKAWWRWCLKTVSRLFKKYNDPDTDILLPPDKRISDEAKSIGEKAHAALGCRSFSRVDMMLDRSGGLFVLEVNTIPGMTERSLLPKAAAASGIEFGRLCIKLVENALNKKGSR